MRYPFIWTLSFPGMFGGLWTLSLSSLVTEGGGGRGAKLGGGGHFGHMVKWVEGPYFEDLVLFKM